MNTTKTLTAIEEQISELLDERIRAIHAKDLPGVLSLYAADVVSFDIGEPLLSKGIGVIKERLQRWFDTYRGPINQEMNGLEVDGEENVAFSYCLMRTDGTSEKGEQFDMWCRATTGFKKIGDRWLITHEHLSEPIDLKTGKGLFDLAPGK
jgi:ketosteroid isomerase-like protein